MPSPTPEHDPIVETEAGAVRGLWRERRGIRSAAFLGIPYALPPVRARRFGAPEPVPAWTGVRDAQEYGATPQRGPVAEVTLIPEPSVPGDDSLNLNVFTPDPGSEAALPVLVYIHGGGFVSGSPASPWYDGFAFTREGIVTVTVSYRLGFDGFAPIDGAPSNRGVRDWLAALTWVQRNIAAFGGDPGRVTIAGQSAGGGAVLTLLGMAAAQPLFHAAWALSPALGDVQFDRARRAAERLAELAGVAPTREALAGVEPERIVELQDTAARFGSGIPAMRTMITEGLPWAPVIDGDLLPTDTVTALRSGIGADKPLVIGSTDDEFTMVTDGAAAKLRFIPASLALSRLGLTGQRRRDYLKANTAQRRRGTAATLGRYVSDMVFRSGVARVAAARGTAPTWVYRFTWVSPRLGWACHCLDVPFWFDCLDADRVDALAGENPPQQLAEVVHTAASAFVRAGDPGWPGWSEVGTTRLFDVTGPATIDDGYASVRALV